MKVLSLKLASCLALNYSSCFLHSDSQPDVLVSVNCGVAQLIRKNRNYNFHIYPHIEPAVTAEHHMLRRHERS